MAMVSIPKYSKMRCMLILLVWFCGISCCCAAVSRASRNQQRQLQKLQSGTHTSNHAIIVSSSRYWFNYRHANNALYVYELCRQQGIPDSNIVLMIADEYVVNPRNPAKNGMYVNHGSQHSLFSAETQIDYRGDDVTVENLLKVMYGISEDGDSSPVLHTDEHSNIFMYWTGHGGDQFFKFQDVEEITSQEIARVFQTMHDQRKYNEILFIADTCQAFTLMDDIEAPNIYAIGSSLRNENSYAHHSDSYLGISVIEHYTYMFIQSLEFQKNQFEYLNAEQMLTSPHLGGARSNIGKREVNCTRPMSTVPLSDFFGNVANSANTNNAAAGDAELLSKMEGYYYGDNVGSTMKVVSEGGNSNEKEESELPPSVSNQTNTQHSSKNENNGHYGDDPRRGMEPTDVRFLACMVAFVSAIVIAAKVF